MRKTRKNEGRKNEGRGVATRGWKKDKQGYSKGVYSAYIRAQQYRTKGRKYRIVSRKAKNMLIDMNVKR